MDASRSRRRSFGAALAVMISLSGAASVAVSATSASATTTVLPCSSRVESTPFARWGDTHPYFLMPNGGFESGSASWTLAGGASVGTGNESYYASGRTASNSLVIPAGGKATSQTICVGRDETWFRLFVKNPGVKDASLQVVVTVQDPRTGQVEHETFIIDARSLGAGWSPTVPLRIPTATGGGIGTQNLTLAVNPIGARATWSIDDVFIDPFRMR